MHLIGDVKGKVAIMVDDMIDTAGWQSVLFPNFFWFIHISRCIPSNIYFFCIIIEPGTITSAAALLKQEGAEAVYACCTHAVFRFASWLY
jgi:ribose-phosphate pyrophosphokinase